MSIVTTAAAVPSRLLTIYTFLADSEKGETRERLESAATPSSLASRGGGEEGDAASALLTTTLQEARRLGLIAEEDGRLKVGELVERKRGRNADREAEFRLFMNLQVLSPERASACGQGGFPVALAWLLSRDPRDPLHFSQAPQDMLRRDIGDLGETTELTNLNRYQNMLYWARYLGFATIFGDGSTRRVVPDPTRAISAVLDRVFEGREVLEIETFVAELARVLPVLEDGEARCTIENERASPSCDGDTFSIATSLALLRLSERQSIALESVADARARILNFGSETGRVSQVRRKGAL